ncbi:MAG TPA: hypothetical protein VI357_04370 [Mycobacteriales bacterium]
MSWPPETTPSAAPGPDDPPTPGAQPHPGRYAPPAGSDRGPDRYPPPGQYPPAGHNGAPGHYPPPTPSAAHDSAPGRYLPPDRYAAAGQDDDSGQYPPAGQYPVAGQGRGPGQYPAAGQYPPPGQYPGAGQGGEQYSYPGSGAQGPYPGAYAGGDSGRLLAPGTFSAPPPGAAKARLWPPSRPEWTTALGAVVALVAAGAAIAPLWVHLAPRLAFRVDQPGRALPVVPEAEEYVGADGRFVFLTLALGVLAALGCWLVRRSRGPLVMVALAAGGLLGAVVTWRLGLRLGTGYQPADLQVVGKVLYQPLTLRARAALVVEPAAAVIVYLLAVGFSARNDLGHDDPGHDDPGRDDPGGDDPGGDDPGGDGHDRDPSGPARAGRHRDQQQAPSSATG